MAIVFGFNEAARTASALQPESQAWRGEFVARSDSMQALLAQAWRAAASDVAVCITGPAGAGKEALARAIHRASARAAGPFVALRCSGVPEAETCAALFGPERESAGSAALAPAAAGGTLFLDEVGELSLALQAKLQRTMEDLEAASPAGVRVIAATRSRLEERMAAGAFREDLYFRLGIIRLAVPPLAERCDDIPALVEHALGGLAARYRRAKPVVADDAMELLVAASWPGNVRQLFAVLEQLVAMAPADLITRPMVAAALGEAPAFAPLDEARRDFERAYLVRVLRIASGNVTRAARLAGRNRTEFYRLLARHGLAPAAFKPARAAASTEARQPGRA